MESASPPTVVASRIHLTRLMALWRSAGWPSRDAVEIDLLAAGWVVRHSGPGGHETPQLTDAGLQLLAAARQRNQRARSAHDRLAHRVALQLMTTGRLVWRELSLRAQVPAEAAAVASPAAGLLFAPDEPPDGVGDAPGQGDGKAWRMARPDVFSVRHTSVERYLQPMVHEIKVSRADLLSDLRHAAKRAAYQWLCGECHYVFPAGIAEPEELPDELGVWVVHGDIDQGRLELLRPARHAACELPFAVWMALAQATPLRADHDGLQAHLGAPPQEANTQAAPPPPP
jgi:hypothetical protein